VVYVEPSRGRIVGGNAGTFLPYILSSVSTFVAVLALIIRWWPEKLVATIY